MWKTWKMAVLGFVSAVVGIALLSALLEWPLSAPLSPTEAASVFGGYYDDCYVDGTANCPDDETCADKQLAAGLGNCPWSDIAQEYVCWPSIAESNGSYIIAANTPYKYAGLSTEDPGYVKPKQLAAINCHERFGCDTYCDEVGSSVLCRKDENKFLGNEASRVPTEPDNTTAECNR